MNLPHDYTASAQAGASSLVTLSSAGLPSIESGPPQEFGGSGQEWSPETLVTAAVADCFVLSFKAIAAASRFEWIDLKCQVRGTLDKVERAIQFTQFQVEATLTISADADPDRAQRLLEKSKQACFITNSLKAPAELTVQLVTQ